MLNKSFLPKCKPVMIGSLPYQNPEPACDLVLKYLSEIPTIPEFPKLGYKATFCGPFLENLPALVDDKKKELFYFDTSTDTSSALEKFYENYLSDNLDYFKISKDRSQGLYSLIDVIKNKSNLKPEYIKTQMPGPITTGLTLKDEKGKNIIYNEEFMQAIIKAIIIKARFQIEKIETINKNIIFFFDEPSLVNYGSSYFNIDKSYIINCLNEVFSSLPTIITGSHCCGNTDWGILMETQVNIISFDAFTYSGVMGLYVEQLNNYINRNGILAWGIIPNSSEILKFSPVDLVAKFEQEVNILVQKGFSREKILELSLITPSCGLGNESIEIAEKVLWSNSEVSKLLKKKFF